MSPTSRSIAAEKPAVDGNRLSYLDDSNPFFPDARTPKLTTPQWVGEPGVDAVVILAVDDMRDTKKYETFLRPILERLKKIDGRAPVSIMANNVAPSDPQLAAWIKEGLSIDVHTLAHPCPLLQKGSFTNAWNTYHGCVDLMSQIPGNKPVAFRMPCCDSMNSPSPRFYSEIFPFNSAATNYLSIDSSVMVRFTPDDPDLPKDVVLDAAGQPRFAKYFPTATNAVTKKSLGSFSTFIENYPYPYVINRQCWEFPAMVPSDWEAFNAHGATNPVTVADWKAALDGVVAKQGVFTFVFHPHGWIRNDQMVEFIDHAVAKYGKRVKFLTFREAQERIDKNLLQGAPLRTVQGDNGVRILDLDNDGFMDVVSANGARSTTRLWQPKTGSFKELPFPAPVVMAGKPGASIESGVRFAIVQTNGFASALTRQGVAGFWHFTGDGWSNDASLLAGLDVAGQPVVAVDGQGKDRGVRFRDIDHDGRCELIVGNDTQRAVLEWSAKDRRWKPMVSVWPKEAAFVTADGRDNGLRFVDANNDGFDDLLQSNEDGYSLWLYIATPRANLGWEKGWTFRVRNGKSGAPASSTANDIPPIVRAGAHRDNGVWFKNGFMWVQNEDTAALPDVVDRRSFKQLVTGDEPGSMSPEESLAAFEVIPGFKVELVASEPLVMDPVAFDWGADRRLWVVEMADYPLGMDGKGKSGGRIVFLTDTDGDGRYDKRTVFMDGVHFPNGIMPWRKGVLVSAAPEIIYAEDTDGDGKADVKKVLFTGFREGNQQHRINGFEFGLDGWVYAANGDSGGQIVPVGGVLQAPATTNANATPIDIRGYDIRFRPDTGELDLIAGQTQFGRHRDDWGNWFGNNNPTWLWHYQLPIEYLKRNPHLAVKSTRTVTVADVPPNRVFAIARLQQRFNWADRVYEVTSANSAAPYRDVLFGPDFATSVFASEPANNVVHREVLEPDGVTFKSRRAPGEQKREFLASKDNWFRPTMLKTGPDGALYIADMYRLILEHPEYFPEELRSRPDLRDGDDKGRIWRVLPVNATLRRVPKLDGLTPAQLATAMDSPNAWQRDTAQRLLMDLPRKTATEQGALKPAVDGLKQLLTASAAKVRLQALAALQGLDAADAGSVKTALADAHPAVRAHAVGLASQYDVIVAAQDREALVRYQAAFRLGDVSDAAAGPTLARLAMRDFYDPNLRIAILSSANRHFEGMLKTVLESMRDPALRSPLAPSLLRELAGLAVARNDVASIQSMLTFLSTPLPGAGSVPIRLAGLGGIVEALGRKNQSLGAFVKREDVRLSGTLTALEPLFAEARTLAADGKASLEERRAAMLVLGRAPTGMQADANLLASLLNSTEPNDIQRAALDSLKDIALPETAGTLLAGWRSYSPSTRAEVLNVLLRRADWTQALLGGVESGAIAPMELGAVARQKLFSHAQAPIRSRAEKLFGAVNGDRQAVVKKYSGVAEMKGDAAKGEVLFRTHCTTCHSFKGEGNAVGPDLGTMADKSVASLLVAILDPNQAIDAAYTPYTLETKDGREFTGIIVSETPASISLRLPGGTESTVVRSDIRKLVGGRLSLMPEGLESVLPPEAMADLVAYLLK